MADRRLFRVFFSVVCLFLIGHVMVIGISPVFATHTSASIPAFPGAEGFGTFARGGRGGQIFIVDTLDDVVSSTDGKTSLRECAQAPGARICVFSIGGTINLNSTLEIRNPYITIAGQTAPGGGITLKAANPAVGIDALKITTYEVIIRYIRSRPGTRVQNGRALSINAGALRQVSPELRAHNIVIDHTSLSWAGDEIIISWNDTNNVTFSWNMIAETLPDDEGGGLKGPNLGKWENGGPYSVHHNILAHHSFRMPNTSAGGGTTDIVNNLIYNFRGIGAAVQFGAMVNIINNYIEAGPDTLSGRYYVSDKLDEPDPDDPNRPLPNPTTRGYFISGNVIQGTYGGSTKILGILPPSTPSSYNKSVRYAAPAVTTYTAQEAYNQVLDRAGATHGLNCDGTWFARRDSVDTRIADSVRNDRSSHNTLPVTVGYITDPSDVGGWPVLAAGSPCPDSDRDGMPNVWETARGLNPNQNDSAADRNGDGYTNIEEYINGPSDDTPLPTSGPTSTPTPTSPVATPTRTPTPQPPTNTPTPPALRGDTNGDNVVNLVDLSTLLSNFGRTGASRSNGDLDGNSVVNLSDLSIVLSTFGFGSSATPTPTQPPGPTEQVSIKINNSADDVEEVITTGFVDAISTDIELTTDSDTAIGNQLVGLRFQNVAIPRNATITNAYVQFTTDETANANGSLAIQGDNVGNSVAFSTTNKVSTRSRTQAQVSWTPPTWTTIGEAGANQQTPNISAVIQEIVSQSTWSSGNALSLIITGTGRRVAEAYDGLPSGAAELVVMYQTGAPTPTMSTGTVRSVPSQYSTIQAAINAAGAGDTVRVAAGTYNEANITISERITLEAATYNTTNPRNNTTRINGNIIINGGSAWAWDQGPVIRGFHIVGLDPVRGQNTAYTLEYSFVEAAGQGNDAVSFESGGGIVRGNIIDPGGDDNIDLDNQTKDILVENNQLLNSNQDGIEVRQQTATIPERVTLTIRNNRFENNGQDGLQIMDYGNFTNRRYIVERNLFRDAGAAASGAGIAIMALEETVENFSAAAMPEPLYAVNNTFINNEAGISGGANLIAVNNIFSGNTLFDLKNVVGDSRILNSLFATTPKLEGVTLPSGSYIVGNPLLNAQYALQSGSPAIDAGRATYQHSYVFNGQTFNDMVLNLNNNEYNGSAPDLGWREF